MFALVGRQRLHLRSRQFEKYGSLREAAFELVQQLAHIAAESGKVGKDLCVAHTLKETSVGLCRGNEMIFAAGSRC